MRTLLSRALAAPARLSPQIWRVLLHSALLGLAGSIADLLFNFYLASLGYGNNIAGLLSTVNRLAGAALGLPIGLLIDRAGARRALLVGVVAYAVGWCATLLSGALWMLGLTQFVIGAALILAQTAVVPLLAHITTAAQRPTVFGMNASAALLVGLAGSLVGGVLPAAGGALLGTSPQSAAAYRLSLAVVVALSLAAALPALPPFTEAAHDETGTDAAAGRRLPIRALLRFALPSLLLGAGGGLFLPFQNLFFRQEFGLSDAVVGVMLAIGALGMGLGAALGGPASARFGLQRAAAWLRFGAAPGMLLMLIPLLPPAVVGFFLRGLCVAASYPLTDALVMQATPPRQRGLAVSLLSIGWALGWSAASAISGWVQIEAGFRPSILAAAGVYVLSAVTIATLRLPTGAATAGR